MSAAETAKEVIRIATTAGLAKDVIDLMEKKLALLAGDLDTATRKNTLLEQRISQLETENRQLQEKFAANQPQAQPVDDPSATDLCPYCQRRKGKVTRIIPSPKFGEFGVKIYYYHCTNCGQDYDREEGPPGQVFMRPASRG